MRGRPRGDRLYVNGAMLGDRSAGTTAVVLAEELVREAMASSASPQGRKLAGHDVTCRCARPVRHRIATARTSFAAARPNHDDDHRPPPGFRDVEGEEPD